MGILQKRRIIEKTNISLIYKRDDKQLKKELNKCINRIHNSDISYLILNISFESKKNYVTKYKLSDTFNQAKILIKHLTLNYFFTETKQNYKVVNSPLADDESGLHFALLFIIGDLGYLDNNLFISLNNVIDFYLYDRILVPIVTHSFSQVSKSFMNTLTTLFDFEEVRFDFSKNNLVWSLITSIENKHLEGNILKQKIQKYIKAINKVIINDEHNLNKEFIMIPQICFTVNFSEMFNCINNEASNLTLLLKNIASLSNIKRTILSFRIKNDDINLIRILFIFAQYLPTCDSIILTYFFDHENSFKTFIERLTQSNPFALRLNYKRLKISVCYGDIVKIIENRSNMLMTLLSLTYIGEKENYKRLREKNIIMNIAQCLC